MTHHVTLTQVEQLVDQLTPREQLRLVAHISERLGTMALPETDDERERREYAAQVEAFLKMCDEMAAETVGEVDSAEDIRQIREERLAQL